MCVKKTCGLAALLVIYTLLGCHSRPAKRFESIAGYNFNNARYLNLKSELDEISGISYYPKDTSLFAIQDEKGFLYKIFIRSKPVIYRWKFSDKGDYEDIAVADSMFYVLQSHGGIIFFKVISKDSVLAQETNSPLDPGDEFETLYYDPDEKKMVILCKDCSEDHHNLSSSFVFDLTTKSLGTTPLYRLDGNIVNQKAGTNEKKIKPSAAAIHPITKQLFILASSNNVMIVADKNGQVINAVKLDPELFKQPEGITFTPSGDLIVSNEAGDMGTANILFFKYQPTQK